MVPRILFFSDYYLPGYKAGGMRAIVNITERLQEEFEFYVITRNYDGRDDKTYYNDVKTNEWNRLKNEKVFYLSRVNLTPWKIRRLIQEVKPHVIYTNSYFSTFTINIVFLRKLRLIDNKIPLIIAPEGELLSGALKLKKFKKQIYLRIASFIGLYDDIIWRMSSEAEKNESLPYIGKRPMIMIAPNMPPKIILPEFDPEVKPTKNIGSAKFVFLSRVHPTKNLMFLIEIIKEIDSESILDIYGPLSDKSYAENCLKASEEARTFKVNFKGEIKHSEVAKALSNYHFFLLPTLGENFGHVIVEALAAGCPVIISDKTPWKGLSEKGIGWELPLEKELWIEILKYCINMDDVTYKQMSLAARNFITDWLQDPEIEKLNRDVILKALDRFNSRYLSDT
jgi:glycosyltransferase involved in cell wall biosynthesis